MSVSPSTNVLLSIGTKYQAVLSEGNIERLVLELGLSLLATIST